MAGRVCAPCPSFLINDEMDIVIVHYNTQKLTDAAIRSIIKHVKNPVIHIFDNSDKTPFFNTYNCVRVIDNTKGQIINFNEWLKGFTNKDVFVGRSNGYGSAKHCISIEKCMEILRKPFVLMDSDVLVKKDFSNICDDDCIFVGERFKKSGALERLLPFICYINTPKCLENKIHYFSGNRMHGLNSGSVRNLYDTGASFLEDGKKYKHKTIECNDYIVHYKAGSWEANKDKNLLSEDEWLNRYRELWDMDEREKNKKVVYTCITGGYDTLIEPRVISKGFDYICFTDDNTLKSKVWQIRPMPKETDGIIQKKKQRFVKINPHIVLADYDLSVWVDGNVRVIGDMNDLIKDNDNSIAIPKHPIRDCIYTEMEACRKLGKDSMLIMQPQINRYKEEKFPEHYGMVQSNIIIRRHNSEDCKRIMDGWWRELDKGSHRDQLSFNYILWKNQDVKIKLLSKDIYRSKWFLLTRHQSKKGAENRILTSIGSSNWKLRNTSPTVPASKAKVEKKVIKRRIYW